jgi:hypothetical protein
MKTGFLSILVALIWVTVLPLRAQRRVDPLTPEEIDLLRDSAIEPEPRMKLYVQFARERLVKLEQMRNDPKTTDRPGQTHRMLEDFLAVYNELNDNLDNFEGRKADLRKAMKVVVEADTEFQAKLRALKDDPRTSKQEAAEYQFVLSDTLETVDNSTTDHRQLQADEEEMWKHKKKSKS